jgi:hypothetical protein
MPSGFGAASRPPAISSCSSTVLRRRNSLVLDLFYLFVAAAGFLMLWGIVEACERV